jgi:hypothetical protein
MARLLLELVVMFMGGWKVFKVVSSDVGGSGAAVAGFAAWLLLFGLPGQGTSLILEAARSLICS